MRKSIFIAVTLMLLTLPVSAQTPGYHCIYGNKDGSTIDVYIDSDIEIALWIATPDTPDSIGFLHNPLASNDDYIVSRDSGEVQYPAYFCGQFLSPDTNSPPGYTNQSLILFYNSGPNPVCIPLNTGGDTILLAKYFIRTANDSSLMGQAVCAFAEGINPANNRTKWGLTDGLTAIYPSLDFSCLYIVDYLAGDANGDGVVNGLDVIYLLNYFRGFGFEPVPLLAGDANGDCEVDGLDVVYLVAYFGGGPEPLLGNCH